MSESLVPSVEPKLESSDSKADDDYIKNIVSESQAIDDSVDSSEGDLYGSDFIDPVYRAKAHLLNEAIREIGMGRYQVDYTPLYLKID